MFNILRVFLITLMSAGIAVAETSSGSSNGFIKADFKREIPFPKMHKLLGAGGGYYFLSRADGSIDAVGEDSQVARTFSPKEGENVLLKHPEAVAVEGDVLYVVDSETDQVVMYSLSTGKYQARFGSKAGGFFGASDENVLRSPRGIAVQEGVVYVADTGRSRIQMFGVNGVFLNTLELASPAAAAATAKGKESPPLLKEPTDIALDGSGRIFVLDADVQQVKIYQPNGTYVKSLPGAVKAAALSVADDGVYVADEVTQVISKFDLDGKLAYTFGSRGEGKSQFKLVSGIAVENGQQVFVGDKEKELINVFVTIAGTKQEALPRNAGRASIKWLGNIAIEANHLSGDGKGTVYAIGKEGKTLLKIHAGKVIAEIKMGEMSLSAVTLDSSGAIWGLDSKTMHCIKMDETGKVLASFGSRGSGAGQFSEPTSIAVAASGLIFVADRGNRLVHVFRSDGVFLNDLSGDATNQYSPVSLSLDSADNLYILDEKRKSVIVYSASGDLSLEFDKLKEPVLFSAPVDLVVTDDELLVLDGNQVKAYTHQGQLLRVFGSKTTGVASLAHPVAIAIAGGSSLFVADKEVKRVHSLGVLYKPEQPKQFVAQGQVHAIELKWAQPKVGYAKEFRVYRSKTENNNFVQIATTTANTFTDAGLDADARYSYRVAVISDYGYEGATSAAASAVSEKFIPAPVKNIEIETTPWQAKLNWDPAAPKYFAAYRIYQKAGDEYLKIGEVTQTEFIRDALTPETKYTLYVSVLSTDGTESEKVPAELTTQVFNRPPLEIEVLKLSDVFSNSYKLYENEGIGRIKLTNNTDKPMDKVRVSFMLKNFMDYSTETKLPKLMPGASEEVVLKAVFNNGILTLTEDTSVQILIEASYFENGKRVAYSRNATINVYDKHRLTWDERERFATFVTPKDPPVLNLARAVVGEYKETKDEAQLAAAFFDALGVFGLTYIQDPSNPYQISSGKTNTVDYIQFPRETLERKSGDCDDLVAFYASGLESMGINTRVLEVPGHMFMMFSTGIAADDDGYTMNNLYVIYEDTLWIPVETTLVGSSFIKAWEKGSAAYYKFKDKGLTVLDVHKGWESFKPASLPDADWKPSGLTRESIEKRFPGDNMSVLKISSQTKTRRYLEAIKKSANDVDSHLQMGIILAKIGDRKEAMKYFDKVLSLDAKNSAAMNNRGNLLMIEDKYQDALKSYQAAAQASPKDAQIMVNVARAYKRLGDTKKAKAAFIKAQGLDESVKEQYRALGQELLNAL